MTFWSKETKSKFSSSTNPFQTPGDALSGTVTAMDIVDNFGKTGETIKPTVLTARGEVSFHNSTHLNQLFAVEEVEVGDHVDIVYVEDKPMPGRSPMKVFTLKVQRSAQSNGQQPATRPAPSDL